VAEKWGRQAVVEAKEPLTREDVERLIEVNGGVAEGLFLRRRDMRRINLWGGMDSEHDVQPFQFQDVDLSWSSLQEAELSWADLEGARLFRSALQGADLSRANLRNAYLSEANLKRTHLQGVNLQDANLETANLQSGMLIDANLQRANLREANLQGANLSHSDMRGADLRGADLRHAYLAKVQISSETNLEEVKWDSKFISSSERNGDYEAAISLYRRLKEWYQGVGMLKIAGEFHYREREAARKAHWQQIGQEFKEYKRQLVMAWRWLKGEEDRV
jgi:uncharacterized protein YjbI with pentapeptide repeats